MIGTYILIFSFWSMAISIMWFLCEKKYAYLLGCNIGEGGLSFCIMYFCYMILGSYFRIGHEKSFWPIYVVFIYVSLYFIYLSSTWSGLRKFILLYSAASCPKGRTIYSVMQLDGNSFQGVVVLDSLERIKTDFRSNI